MPSMHHQAIIERWFHELFTGNVEVLDELVIPDFVSYNANGKVGAASAAAFKTWLEWYLASFTDAEWTILEIVSEGEKAVARYVGWTTYRGGLLNIPSTNQRVEEYGVLIFRIVDGKVHELWSALCDLELVLGLGAVPVVPENPA